MPRSLNTKTDPEVLLARRIVRMFKKAGALCKQHKYVRNRYICSDGNIDAVIDANTGEIIIKSYGNRYDELSHIVIMSNGLNETEYKLSEFVKKLAEATGAKYVNIIIADPDDSDADPAVLFAYPLDIESARKALTVFKKLRDNRMYVELYPRRIEVYTVSGDRRVAPKDWIQKLKL